MRKDLITKLRDSIKHWYNPKKRKEYNDIVLANIEDNDKYSLYKLYLLNYNKAFSESSSEKAILYCQKAAELGLPEAQYDLGLHYLYGDIVEKDIFLALSWIEKAADQDYVEASKKLVSLYLGNIVTKRNESRAEYWRNRASGISREEIETIIPISAEMIEAPNRSKENKGVIFAENESLKEKTAISKDAGGKIFEDTIGKSFVPGDQDVVINAPTTQSFVVNAGPGTGKTYTLIRRINYLVEHGIEARNIVVLSFTNAVVNEILIRLNSLVKEGGDREVRNTTVKTYHTLAWLLMKEANELTYDEDFELDWEEKSLNFDKMNYEDGLIVAANLIEKNPKVVDGFECLIVDEIQDINNAKALFVTSLVKACVKFDVPILLLGDYCQAIYNYANVNNTANVNISTEQFYRDVMSLTEGVAKLVCFERNFRQNDKLKELTMQFRQDILAENISHYRDSISEMCEKIKVYDSFDDVCDFIKDNSEKNICLMERANLETKLLSTALSTKNIAHYCVVGQDKYVYPGMIAQIFSGYSEPAISRERFENIIKNRGLSISEEKTEEIWDRMVSETDSNSNVIDMIALVRCFVSHGLDKILADSFEKPNVCVSNVHKSKGLEYDMVIIDKSLIEGDVNNNTDEAKVLYVALTRSKENVVIMNSKIKWGKYHKHNNKAYREFKKIKNKDKKYVLKYVEVKAKDDCGYPDVSPANYLFEDVAEMQASQEVIRKMVPGDPVELIYNKQTDLYDIHSVKYDNMIIGCMPQHFTKSLRRIPKESTVPKILTDIYIDGVYSFVGTTDGFIQEFERKAIDYNNEYSKYRIWNYVKFSGPAIVKGIV